LSFSSPTSVIWTMPSRARVLRPRGQQPWRQRRRGAGLLDRRAARGCERLAQPVDLLTVNTGQQGQPAGGLLPSGQRELALGHLHVDPLQQLRKDRVGDAEVQQQTHHGRDHAADGVQQELRGLRRGGVEHGSDGTSLFA